MIEITIKGSAGDPGDIIKPTTILKLVGLKWTQWLDQNFKDGGTENKWVPLSPMTVLTRKRGGNAPLQDTGLLRQTLTAGAKVNEAALTVSVGTDLPYARYHEDGVGPFVIMPKNAKILAAKLLGGGFVMLGKKVNHPGIPRRPLLPTKALAERMAQETAQAAFDRAVEIFNRGS